MIVSVAARGLEVAMLCREGTADSGVGSQYLSAMGKGGGGVIAGPPHTPLRYTYPHQVLPEVQVRRWRRLSGRGFMTKSGSYSLLIPSPHPTPGRQCTR